MITSSIWTTVFDWEKKKEQLSELEKEASKEGVWDDHEKTGKLFKKIEILKNEIKQWKQLKNDTKELTKMLAESQAEDDLKFIEGQLSDMEKKYNQFEKQTLFDGQYDQNDVALSIHAGAGGDDAQDWAGMLLRMFLRFAERKGYGANVLQQSEGSEAGIKSATVEFSGEMVFGNLKSEAGVHRLVRLSPFNADNLRQTSFALVEVIPLIENEQEVKIDSKDLRVDTYRSSGAGGQSVNTTDSAVRITHLPTNIVVTCQNERSQLQNKEKALAILQSKLAMQKQQEENKEKEKLKGEHKSAEWGNQIRSYVLHPYKMVKDHRTKVESKDPDDVLDGNLEKFIEGYLKQQEK